MCKSVRYFSQIRRILACLRQLVAEVLEMFLDWFQNHLQTVWLHEFVGERNVQFFC